MIIATRHPQWEARLTDTMAAWGPRAYRFAPGHDCAAFVLACIEAVSGVQLDLGALAYRSEKGQARALRRLGYRDLPAACDGLLGGRIGALAAHRGDVVSDGSAVGVMTASGPVVFSEAGMVAIERHSVVAAWPVGRAE